MTARDLQELEQAVRLIVQVVERMRVHEENAQERRREFKLTINKERKEP